MDKNFCSAFWGLLHVIVFPTLFPGWITKQNAHSNGPFFHSLQHPHICVLVFYYVLLGEKNAKSEAGFTFGKARDHGLFT
jgi:hypothetical protein